MTKAQKEGLRVLAITGEAAVSNGTSDTPVHRPAHGNPVRAVYWQTARWLEAQGFARQPQYYSLLTITQAGVRAAKELNLT